LKSEFVEGKSGEFTFAEESPYALWRVLQFMYHGDYSDEGDKLLEAESKYITKAAY
jgi:hypothetical protein